MLQNRNNYVERSTPFPYPVPIHVLLSEKKISWKISNLIDYDEAPYSSPRARKKKKKKKIKEARSSERETLARCKIIAYKFTADKVYKGRCMCLRDDTKLFSASSASRNDRRSGERPIAKGLLDARV